MAMRVWFQVAATVVLVLAGVAVRGVAGNPGYYKADCPSTTTTFLVTSTKTDEVTKTVHQARYVITTTETAHKTEYRHVTETVYQKNHGHHHHAHTKYVVSPVTVTERTTQYDTKTVTHLKEKTQTKYVPTTVTKTIGCYGGY